MSKDSGELLVVAQWVTKQRIITKLDSDSCNHVRQLKRNSALLSLHCISGTRIGSNYEALSVGYVADGPRDICCLVKCSM